MRRFAPLLLVAVLLVTTGCASIQPTTPTAKTLTEETSAAELCPMVWLRGGELVANLRRAGVNVDRSIAFFRWCWVLGINPNNLEVDDLEYLRGQWHRNNYPDPADWPADPWSKRRREAA